MKVGTLWKPALVVVLVALLAGATWVAYRPSPPLQPIVETLAAGRLDEGEAQLRAFLKRDPSHARARLLLALSLASHFDADGRLDSAHVREALEQARLVKTPDASLTSRAAVLEGDMAERLGRLDEAEAAWKRAIEREPTGDGGWFLLKLYELQNRTPERRALALRLHRLNPRPAAKRRALIDLIRLEIHHPAAAGTIAELAPVVAGNPSDWQSVRTLGRAEAREGKVDEGVARLRALVAARPDDPDAWDALLTALEDAGRVEDQARELARAPAGANSAPWRARHEGWLAQERGDFKAAATAYRQALDADPLDSKLGYRLGRALRLGGQADEAEKVEQTVRAHDAARKELRALYEAHESELNDDLDHNELFQQVASLRERLGAREEARGWHALVLLGNPSDPVSQAAVERLR